MITYKNDGKGKEQSHQATAELDENNGSSFWMFEVTAYGKDKAEADVSLRTAIGRAIAKLQDQRDALDETK